MAFFVAQPFGPPELDVYEVRTVLWERGAPLDLALAWDPAWQLVHRGRLADVYVRRPRR